MTVVPDETPNQPDIPDDDTGETSGWNDAPVSGDRVDVHMGPIIAGDTEGARVEVTGDGLHAYDSTGTETAHIKGEGGEFVGGSFRTSDNLPGQVRMSDTANVGTPGISVEPEDSSGYDVLPSIGPGPTEMWVSGGVSTDGTTSGANFHAEGTSIYHNGPGANGAGSWVLTNGDGVHLLYREGRQVTSVGSSVRVRPGSAVLASEHTSGHAFINAGSLGAWVSFTDPAEPTSVPTSFISADATEALLSMRPVGGRTRRLRVDESGIWVETETGPNTWRYDGYNLENVEDRLAALEARIEALEN